MSSPAEAASGWIERLLERSRYAGPTVAWGDIIGHEAAKRELAVVAETLRRSSTASELGVPLVKGLLIWGAPGTGKTMLAKALASSVGRPAYVIPSAEMTAARMRRLYERLNGETSVVVFDEADVILEDRRWSDNKLAAAFCAAIDGVNSLSGPVTVALTATSAVNLDPSAVRAGRLTTKVHVARPTEPERLELWSRAINRVPLRGEIDVAAIAARTERMTGADIDATVLVALGLSMVDGSDGLTAAVLDEAIARNHNIDETPRPAQARPVNQWPDAIHEAGHVALAVHHLGANGVKSVQLAIGNGRASEASISFPAAPTTPATIRGRAQIALAGTIAEALEFGADDASVGSHFDMRDATTILHELVTEHGGSTAIGLMSVRSFDTAPAQEMATLIWQEVRRELESARSKAEVLLTSRIGEVHAFAHLLHDSPDRRLEGPSLRAAIAESFGIPAPPLPPADDSGLSAANEQPRGRRLNPRRPRVQPVASDLRPT